MFQVQVDMMRKLEKRKLNFIGQHIHVVIFYLLCPFKDGILGEQLCLKSSFLCVCHSNFSLMFATAGDLCITGPRPEVISWLPTCLDKVLAFTGQWSV